MAMRVQARCRPRRCTATLKRAAVDTALAASPALATTRGSACKVFASSVKNTLPRWSPWQGE